MKTFLKGTITGSLILSLLIHFGLLGSMTVDWHLAEQWEGLKAAVSQIAERVKSKETVGGKIGALADTAVQEAKQTVDSFMKGEKIRLGPDSEGWKKLDEQIALEQQQKEQALAEKRKEQNGGSDPFSRFLKPPMEIEIVERPPEVKEEEKGSGVEMTVDFKQDNCPDNDPKVKSYGGIGLQFAPATEVGPNGQTVISQPLKYLVHVVPEGYPADRAGIKVGDIIEGNPIRFRGEIGTPLTVEVIRNGRLMKFNMTRVKICYEAPPPATGINFNSLPGLEPVNPGKSNK